MEETYRFDIPSSKYFLDLISCRSGCPVRTNAGAYVRAIKDGEFRKGYDVASSPNPFASVCAHVCAHPCESRCRRGIIDEPISIRALKRTLTERHGVESAVSGISSEIPQSLNIAAHAEGKPAAIAVVGSGPAGITCAHDLAFLGYEVTVFEAASVLGGMVYQGIPEYRLPRDVIRSEIDRVARMGVTFRTDWKLGRDFTIGDLLRNRFSAVFLAFGATHGRDLKVPGSELDRVIDGVDFLLNANLGYHVDLGNNVVVVGGGNVAIDVARTVLRFEVPPEEKVMPHSAASLLTSWGYDNTLIDAARTALRLGARAVTIMCLERLDEMPASMEEIAAAEEESIRLLPGVGAKRFLGKRGRVTSVETLDVASVFDSEGRFDPAFVPGSEHQVAADTVILAIGQTPDLSALSGDHNVSTTPDGLIQVNPQTLETTMPRVFCGGDLAFGPRTLIDAAGDGKRAALKIHKFLGGAELPKTSLSFRRLQLSRWTENYDSILRQEAPYLPIQRRTGFRLVELEYPEKQAIKEAQRCLWCNVSPIFDSEKCIMCGGCVDICPENCLKLVRADRLRGEVELSRLRSALGTGPNASAILKDEERCIRCGLCADRCPNGAITMELLEIDDSQTSSLKMFSEELE